MEAILIYGEQSIPYIDSYRKRENGTKQVPRQICIGLKQEFYRLLASEQPELSRASYLARVISVFQSEASRN